MRERVERARIPAYTEDHPATPEVRGRRKPAAMRVPSVHAAVDKSLVCTHFVLKQLFCIFPGHFPQVSPTCHRMRMLVHWCSHTFYMALVMYQHPHVVTTWRHMGKLSRKNTNIQKLYKFVFCWLQKKATRRSPRTAPLPPNKRYVAKQRGPRVRRSPRTQSAALDAVASGRMGVREAARHYGVPRSWISDHRTGKYQYTGAGHPTILTVAEEKRLIWFIDQAHQMGFPLTWYQIKGVAAEIVQKSSRKRRFKNGWPSKSIAQIYNKSQFAHFFVYLYFSWTISQCVSKLSPHADIGTSQVPCRLHGCANVPTSACGDKWETLGENVQEKYKYTKKCTKK